MLQQSTELITCKNKGLQVFGAVEGLRPRREMPRGRVEGTTMEFCGNLVYLFSPSAISIIPTVTFTGPAAFQFRTTSMYLLRLGLISQPAPCRYQGLFE